MRLRHYGKGAGMLAVKSWGLLLILSGCISVTDVTNQADNPAVTGNMYCRKGTEFVVQFPLEIGEFRSRSGGYTLYEDPDMSGNRTDFGPNKAMQALGYLNRGDMVRVDRVVWVRHFDVGDHVEIRATVMNGRYKGLAVDLKNVQKERLLKPVAAQSASAGN